MWKLISVLLPFLPYSIGCRASVSRVLNLTVYSGEAVLLPCFCTELDDRPGSSSWLTNSRTASAEHLYTDVFSVSDLRSRITRFNHTTSGNLSLLLSDLTQDDQGWYVCWIEEVSRFIHLTVEGSERTEFPRSLLHYCILTALLIIITGGAAITLTYCTHKAYKNNTNSTRQPASTEQKQEFPSRNSHRVKDKKQQEHEQDTNSSAHSDLQKYDCETDSAITQVVPENEDEYCSMYSILPLKIRAEEVYANMDEPPQDQEYVSMMHHCSAHPDLIQNTDTTATSTRSN